MGFGWKCVNWRWSLSRASLVIGFSLGMLGSGSAVLPDSADTGTTYYLDSVTGVDSNSGTSPERAWKTLAKVNRTEFHSRDAILLKSGSSWTGQLWPKGSGTEQYPIRVGKYGGEAKPVINSDGLVEDAVLLKNQQYWEIGDLEVTNTGKGASVRRGVRLVAENSGELHHIYLRNLTVHDVNGTDEVKENGGITYSCTGNIKPSRFVDLRIENNRIYHVDRNGIMGSSTHWMRTKWYPSLEVVIRHNTLDDIGGDGIVPVATDGALVEYNVVGHGNQRSQGYNDGIWPWSADNTIVQYNEVYGMHGQRDGLGFDSDWNSRNTIIQYNYSHDNEGGFLLICNEGRQDPRESVGNVGTIARYNISQNDHHRGVNVSGPISDALVYNNTIYVGKSESVDLLVQVDWGGWSQGISFYNNIFYVEGSGRFSHAVSHQEDGEYITEPGFGGSTNNLFDYNVYYGNVKPEKGDAHALASDPRLKDPGGAGLGWTTAAAYQLMPGSPAIGAGLAMKDDGGRDFFGTPVPSCGGVDRGAAEMAACSSSAR